MKKTDKIESMVNITLDEFSELYKIKTNVESLLKYMNRVEQGQPFKFMIKDITNRMESYLEHYNNNYDRASKTIYKK